MPTCPNGHQSGSEDWCEVCGHRMAGAGAVPPLPPPPPPAPGYGFPQGQGTGEPAARAELCPQCRTPRESMAPFCEECRWNFLTSTATSYTPLAPQGGPGGPVPGLNLPPGFQSQPGPTQPPQQPPPPQQHHQAQQRDSFEYQGSRPSQMNRPAEPLSPEDSGRSGPPSPPPLSSPPPSPFQQQGSPPPPPFQQQSSSPFDPQGRPSAFEPQHQQGPPSPFQQQALAPFEQRSAPPQPQTPQTGEDDWMLPPPSQAQAPAHQQQQPPQGFPQGPRASWTAVIAPDRDYFLAMMNRSGPEATGLNLPAYSPEQHLPLTGGQITIGRRRHSTGESPDIDLAVPPEDPGVSHQHAMLVQQPDGGWAVVDQNSTNGTTLNGAADPIQPYVPVPLQDGDQVHVGAWTTITVTVRRD